MPSDALVFLDTSVLFAAVLSPSGGARAIMKMGEANVISLWVGAKVLRETDEVVRKKFPQSRSRLALLLQVSNVQIGPTADPATLASVRVFINYESDALVLAEALAAGVDYFVTLDRKHFLDNAPLRSFLPIPLGTPGDFLTWYRSRLQMHT